IADANDLDGQRDHGRLRGERGAESVRALNVPFYSGELDLLSNLRLAARRRDGEMERLDLCHSLGSAGDDRRHVFLRGHWTPDEGERGEEEPRGDDDGQLATEKGVRAMGHPATSAFHRSWRNRLT